MYTDVEEAWQRLQEDEQCVAADTGEDAVEAAWADLVNNVAMDCDVATAQELRRRAGL